MLHQTLWPAVLLTAKTYGSAMEQWGDASQVYGSGGVPSAGESRGC
jgi:hypothetical protein